ncbi:hypothetical protein ACFLT8_06220 [Chloroflexota bacterium]
MSMPEIDREYLENMATLLGEADGGDGSATGAPGEPLTLHRRGHWFEPSIAHHSISSI